MKIILRLVLGIALLIYSSLSLAEVTGKVAVTTNYMWRGVSQTQNRPAVQGTLNYNIADSGIYVGVFGSNVDFGEQADPETLEMPPIAHSEIDWSAGYTHDYNDDWTTDIGITMYTYPGASLNNYNEGYASVRYKIVTIDGAYSNDTFSTGTDGYYGGIGIKYELFKGTSSIILKDMFVSGHIGYSIRNRDVDGGNYTDYMLCLSKDIKGVNLELSWTDTSGRSIQDNVSSSRVFFTVSKEF